MSSNLNISDKNYRSVFSTSHLKQSQIAATKSHNIKQIISREAFQDLDGKYSHEIGIHWNGQFQQENYLANKIFRNLKTESL